MSRRVYVGGGGLCPGGISVQGVSVQGGLSPGGGGLCPGGLGSGGSVSMGSVSMGSLSMGSVSRGIFVRGSLSTLSLSRGALSGRPPLLPYGYVRVVHILLACILVEKSMHTVEEELGILTYNGPMFSLPHFHFQFKSVNVSIILTSKLKMCTYL